MLSAYAIGAKIADSQCIEVAQYRLHDLVVMDAQVVDLADGHPYRGPLETGHSLSAREREVLAHIAAGQSNAAIARTLVISEAAVGKHAGNIFAKPDSQADDTNRRVLAVLAYLRGNPKSCE